MARAVPFVSRMNAKEAVMDGVRQEGRTKTITRRVFAGMLLFLLAVFPLVTLPSAYATDYSRTVYVSSSGKYHYLSNCSGMKHYTEKSLQKALDDGDIACKKCVKETDGGGSPDPVDPPVQTYLGFTDVSADDWYNTEDAYLAYVLDNGLMSGYKNADGTSNGLFGPYDEINRGQVATILWRMSGSPIESAERFQDVDYGLYYGDAINWARSEGVISGYEDLDEYGKGTGTYTNFGPEDPVTREQFAKMMAGYAEIIAGVDVTTDRVAMNAIAGASHVSEWALDSMGWAVDAGLVSGIVSDGGAQLDPKGSTWRCAAAKMITKMHRDVIGSGEA